MNEIQEFLTILAQGLLVIALPILIAAAAQHFRTMRQRMDQELGQERAAAIEHAVTVAVQAAEQSGMLEGLIGEEKRERALKIARAFLKERGVNLDVDKLAALVESEVLEQFNHPAMPADTLEARRALIDAAVETAVLAAEQSGLKGHIRNLSDTKKEYAMDIARQYLDVYGMVLEDSLIDGLIEAELLRLALAARGISLTKVT